MAEVSLEDDIFEALAGYWWKPRNRLASDIAAKLRGNWVQRTLEYSAAETHALLIQERLRNIDLQSQLETVQHNLHVQLTKPAPRRRRPSSNQRKTK